MLEYKTKFKGLFAFLWSACFCISLRPEELKGLHILYRGAGKSLARPTSRCILFDGENISFDASLALYIYIYIYIYI
jgi:hypothetical protein